MGTILMSAKERRRLELFGRVGSGELTIAKVAQLLGLSYRQAKRVWRRYRDEGDIGLTHKLRGRPSARAISMSVRERVLELYRTKYADFGPTLAAEYMASDDDMTVCAETLRRWLVDAGFWTSRVRRQVHRRRRARREHIGELIQMDGSHHDWFEGRRAWAVLMVMIDDSSNRTYARFFEGETTFAAMEIFERYVSQYGLPHALYVDRASIYRPARAATIEEELSAKAPTTQFGRAMAELNVELILAHSPQAKGRVERSNGVLQDRLVKALRLSGKNDLESANAFLESEFLPAYNERFMRTPAKPSDLHRKLPQRCQLDNILAVQDTRVVQNDWTLSWNGRCLQLTIANQKHSLVGKEVTVIERRNGSIALFRRSRELPFTELASRPKKSRSKATTGPKAVNRTGHKPAVDHPWRRG
jgi:transposase